MQVRCWENLKAFITTEMNKERVPGKEFLIDLKKINRERGKFLFLYPLSGKPFDLCQGKSMLGSFYNVSRYDI